MAKSTFNQLDDQLGNERRRARVVNPVGHDRFLAIRKPAKAAASDADTTGFAGGSRAVVNVGGPASGQPRFASPIAVARALASRSGRAPDVTPPGLAGPGTPPVGPRPVPTPLAMPGEQPQAPQVDTATGKTFAAAPPAGEYGGDPLSPVWGVTPAGAQSTTPSLIEALRRVRKLGRLE